jgi:hypothetical protein
MLVSLSTAKYGLALAEMIDAVDQFQLLEFLDSAINGHQTNIRHHGTCLSEKIQRGERTTAAGNNTKDHMPWTGNTVATAAKLAYPFFCSF